MWLADNSGDEFIAVVILVFTCIYAIGGVPWNILYWCRLIPKAKYPMFGLRVLSTIWTIILLALASLVMKEGIVILFYLMLVCLKIWSDHIFRTKVSERNPG